MVKPYDNAPQPEAESLFSAIRSTVSAVFGVQTAVLDIVCPERSVRLGTSSLDRVADRLCDQTLATERVLVVHDLWAEHSIVGPGSGRFFAGCPLRSPEGEVIGLLAIVDPQPRAFDGADRDILRRLARVAEQAACAIDTLRLQTEAITAQAARLEHIIDGTGVGTWEWNVQTGETRFNERWAGIMGYTLAELGPTDFSTWSDRVHPADLKSSRSLLEAHFRDGSQTYEVEVRMLHREGHWVWVLSCGRVMTWTAEGEPEWMFGTHTDLTLRREHNLALAKSQRLLERTGSVAQVGGWIFDLPAGIPYWNAQTRRIYGVPDDYVPNNNDSMDFFPPESRQVIESVVQRALETGESWDVEVEMDRADGRRIWIRSVGEAELGPDGEIVRLLGAVQDVTDSRLHRPEVAAVFERLSLANDNAGVGVWELDLVDHELVWDEQTYRLYGLQPQEDRLPFSAWGDRIHPEDHPGTCEAVRAAIEQAEALDLEYRVLWPDGTVRVLHSIADIHHDLEGRPTRVIGLHWDVTEERAQQQAILDDRARLQSLTDELRDQHERMRVTMESIGDAVITTDPDGRVEWMNPVAHQLTGWGPGEATGIPVMEVFYIVDGATGALSPCPVLACLSMRSILVQAEETTLRSRTGETYGIKSTAAPILSDADDVIGAILVFHDVTEQRRLTALMTYRATHDDLTGLINRAELEQRLERTVRRAQTDGSTNALMFLDLDRFKIVNDTCGHAVGDQVLEQVAALLAAGIRSTDSLARLGGDEFAILLDHCPVEIASSIAERLCATLDAYRFVHDGQSFRLGTSIGLVVVDDSFEQVSTVLQAADASCYAAKEAGRGQYHRWHDSDATLQRRRGETLWATRIEDALDNDGFVLHLQHLQAIQNDAAPSHAEVLLRMRGPDGDLILPGAFLPSACRFGLAARIDLWVLEQTLELLDQPSTAHSSVDVFNVNLSGQSLGDRSFHRTALRLLDSANRASCRRLCLEVTETEAITRIADARSFLSAVRTRGVRIALDDFGAGASSFGYLKELPVDILKIDGQFIERLLDDALDDITVRCFVKVAAALGLTTVAEFVDDPRILERVRELGVDYAQGFLLHQPEDVVSALGSKG